MSQTNFGGVGGLVGRKARDALSPEMQGVVSEAARRTHAWMVGEMRQRNAAALEEMTRTHGVQVVDLPESVLAAVQRSAEQIFQECGSGRPYGAPVGADAPAFSRTQGRWGGAPKV